MSRRLQILLVLALCWSCSQAPEIDQTRPISDGELRGVSLSPKSYAEGDFSAFLDRVGDTQDVLMWAGDWMELANEGAPATVSELSKVYGFIPIIEVGHYTQNTGALLRPLNIENRQIYLDSTLAFVEEFHPAYFGMGVEINVFAEKNPDGFEAFVPFYNEIYERIKEVSPATRVFTVFQLEKMKGLSMWEIEKSEPQWEMIGRFTSDLVAFTTYPGLFYRDVTEIPEDHYTQILEYTNKPIAFTEIGWHSASSPAGWESSQAEQADFVRRFFELTQTIDMEVAIWSFMYDPDTFEPFDSMGLIDRNGIEKLSWEEWIQ